MGRRVMIVVLSLIFSLGAVMISWAPVRGIFARREARQMRFRTFEMRMAQAEDAWLEKHRTLARWYNHGLSSGLESQELEKAYPTIGALGPGPMGWISVPDLSWEVLLYHGVGEEEEGVRHDGATPFPLGIPGQISTFLFGGEWDLSCLEPGMEVHLTFLGECRRLFAAPEENGETWLLADSSGNTAAYLVPVEKIDTFRREEDLRPCVVGVLSFWALPVAGEFIRAIRGLTGNGRSKKRKKSHSI